MLWLLLEEENSGPLLLEEENSGPILLVQEGSPLAPSAPAEETTDDPPPIDGTKPVSFNP